MKTKKDTIVPNCKNVFIQDENIHHSFKNCNNTVRIVNNSKIAIAMVGVTSLL